MDMNSEENKMTVQEIYDACCEGCSQYCPENYRCSTPYWFEEYNGSCILMAEHSHDEVIDLSKIDPDQFREPNEEGGGE